MILNIEPDEAYYVACCIIYARNTAKWAKANSPLGDRVMEQLVEIEKNADYENHLSIGRR